MKTTRYFEERVLVKRPYLKRKWCEQALTGYIHREVQSEDERVRCKYSGEIDISLRTAGRGAS